MRTVICLITLLFLTTGEGIPQECSSVPYLSGPGLICSPQQVTLTAETMDNSSPVVHRWYKNGAVFQETRATNTGSSYKSTLSASVTGNTRFTVTTVCSNNKESSHSYPLDIQIVPTPVVSVSISAGPVLTPSAGEVIICEGKPVTLTAVPSVTEPAARYYWRMSRSDGTVIISQREGITFSPPLSEMRDGDKITLEFRPNLTCAPSLYATSQTVLRIKIRQDIRITDHTNTCDKIELNATGSYINHYNWYSDPSCTQLIATGSALLLDNDYDGTVYAVSSDGCYHTAASYRVTPIPPLVLHSSPGCSNVMLKISQQPGYRYYFQTSPVSTDTLHPFTSPVSREGTFYVRGKTGRDKWTCASNPVTITRLPQGNCDRNFIRERIVQQENITNSQQVDLSNSISRYTYYDGLGRHNQTVNVRMSPGEGDIVTPVTYDRYGRQDRQWLSYEAGIGAPGSYRENDTTGLKNFYAAGRSGIPSDTRPWSQVVFGPSPLNRPEKHYGPGQAWAAAGKHVATGYGTNTVGEVRLWKKTANGLDGTTCYNPGTLYKTMTTDEDGNRSVVFTDFQERVIREDRMLDNQAVTTQYVYDDFGRRAYVIQPAYFDAANKPAYVMTENDAAFSRWVFADQYDQKGRIVRKHIPGAGWTEIVYNRQDQPVMTRSAQQKVENKWCFSKYDAHGRPVMSGELTGANTREQWQSLVDAGQYQWEERSMAAGNIGRYTNRCQPVVTLAQVDMILYYDRYDFDTGGAPARQTAACSRTQGLHTGTRARVPGSDTWLTSINYYDDRGLLQESISKSVRNKWERLVDEHDFTGRITQSVHSHDNSQVVLRREQTYDHAGRPADTWTTIGQGERVLTTRNAYNELGQPATSRLHGTGNGTAWLQEVDYRYNIRGWLSSINGDMDRQDAFSERMLYHEPSGVPGLSSTPAYNGNISAIFWSGKSPGSDPAARHYNRYQYDRLNRLNRYVYSADTIGTGHYQGRFSYYNCDYRYDANGNFISVQRAYRNKPVDNAGFTYDGNRLTAVNDWSRHAMGLNSSRYTYDASGRLKTDSYKGITVDYNYMDLPVTVTKGSEKLEYTYLADGTRVKRKSGSNERHYIHGFEYEGNTLRFVSIPEGRIRRKDNGTWVYDYFLRDHLSNTRVVLTTEQSGTQTYRATMEESTAGQEREHFENVDASRTDRPYNYPDLNPANARVAKVPGRGEGPKLTLKVTAGDTVSISAQAFYNIERTLPAQGADVVPVVGSAIAALAGGAMVPAGEAAALALDLGATAGTSVALSSVPNRQDQDGNPAPRAGIRYVLYDNDFEVVETSTGILPVEDRINRVQNLSADRMVLPVSGYLEVYAGNDDQTPVYFDNLTVSHTPGRILEESHYYPYGLLIPGISTTALAVNERNAYKFGGKEMQTDLDLNWGDFGARMQDPVVGRWWVPDPMAENHYNMSSYVFAGNNPIRFIDPDGKDWYSYQKEYEDENGETQTQTQYVYYNGTMSEDDMKAGGYTYVGETVSIANEDGSYTNYYQNIGFTSDEAFNARDYILDNGLVGQYAYDESSKLDMYARRNLAQASIYRGQENFLNHEITQIVLQFLPTKGIFNWDKKLERLGLSKASKKSGKEKASDAPDWAKSVERIPNETAEEFTKRALNRQYGEGNWTKGAGNEYNKIKKWYERSIRAK